MSRDPARIRRDLASLEEAADWIEVRCASEACRQFYRSQFEEARQALEGDFGGELKLRMLLHGPGNRDMALGARAFIEHEVPDHYW